jgi:hypothetical protein
MSLCRVHDPHPRRARRSRRLLKPAFPHSHANRVRPKYKHATPMQGG